jgi:Ca-activated chloride channel homolog
MRARHIWIGLLIPLAFMLGCPADSSDDDDQHNTADDDDAYYDDDDYSDDDASDDDDGEYTGDDDDDDDDSATEDDVCDEIPVDPTTLYLSADDSNSMAAPAIARQLIREDNAIHGGMRPYEFLNYYDFHYPAADPGHLDIHPQMRLEEDGSYTMLIGVAAPSADDIGRRPRSLTFSVDSSGSMSGHSLTMTKAVLNQIAHNLEDGDIVSLLSWDTNVTVLLETEEVSGPDDPDFIDAINSLGTGGSTDLHQGLVRAYELAEAAFAEDRLNRVILISDGGANTGVTDTQLIASHADDADGEGIYMVGIGAASPASYYSDGLMDGITDSGRGAYVFIDDADEAEVIFGDDERFLSVMEVAARSVQVEMIMPAGFVMDEFHGEEYSENPQEVEPQHLAPNDAMLFHQILADCAPEEHDGSEVFQFTVTWVDPVTRDPRVDTVSLTVTEMLAQADSQLLKADVLVDYAMALTGVWDLPVGEREAYLLAVQQAADDAYVATGDADLAEVSQYLAMYIDDL